MLCLLFKERSHLFGPLLIGPFLISVGILTLLGIQSIHETDHFKLIFNLIIFILVLAVLIFMLSLKLTLTIWTDKIIIRYFPFKRVRLNKKDIKTLQLLKVDPIKEFGGWGLKKSNRYGPAYTTKGNYILFIETLDGGKISISVINITLAQSVIASWL